MRFLLLPSVALLLAVGGPAAGQQLAATDTNDVYQTKHHYWLSFPQLLWTGLVWPLGQFTIYAEHSELPQRVHNFFTNADHTFGIFPQVQFGGETGTAGGLRLFHNNLFGAGKQLELLYLVRNGERHKGAGLYHDPSLGGSNFNLTLEGDFLKTDNQSATVNGGLEALEDLGGVGEIENGFAVEQADVLASLGWSSNAGDLAEFTPELSFALRLGYGRRELSLVNPAADSLQGLVPSYTPRARGAAGLGQALSFFSAGIGLGYDDRDYQRPVRTLTHPLNYQLPGRILLAVDDLYYHYRDTYFPERGGLLRADADLVQGGDDVSFLRWSAEVQRFFTLFWRYRILAVRARIEKVHALGDDGIVPYVDLPTLGGSQRLRGYKRGFFRGEGALLLSAEYRYPIWDTWNAFLFFDEAQVFDRFDQIKSDRFEYSWGGGLSLRTVQGFLVSVRLARSDQENALIGFSLEQEF